MVTELKDLVAIDVAASVLKRDSSELLFRGLAGDADLFCVANQDEVIQIYPCRREWIDEERFSVDVYDPHTAQELQISTGQIVKLTEAAIKCLLVNKFITKLELYRCLFPELPDTSFDYWRVRQELYPDQSWKNGAPCFEEIPLVKMFTTKSEAKKSTQESEDTQFGNNSATSTALKVIGLLMYHLAKSPKYATGSKPNKSQIKALLQELADELGVDDYGLNKVDERVLSEAMKHLENQKR